MDYNEEEFKKKANLLTSAVWLALCIILSVSCIIDTISGLHRVVYLGAYLFVCWITYLAGVIFLHFKGVTTDLYKYVVTIGYGIFYVFTVITSDSLICFAYVFPMMSTLILFKDKKFMTRSAILYSFISIFNIIYQYFILHMNTTENIREYKLMFVCVILSYICYNLSINHMSASDSALTNSIQDNLKRVIETINKVKTASMSVVDGVTVVRELADENRQGANNVVNSMEELTSNNTILHEKTMSSMDMTSSINKQSQNVAHLIQEMMELVEESATHSAESSRELLGVVELTNAMANLSSEIKKILNDFNTEFEHVKQQTSMIEEITTQTSLLSLNASIEAARAGEAGKGFAVVADEIHKLSNATQDSSTSILEALTHLENTSDKMTDSITQTLDLIQNTSHKVNQVNKSVSTIKNDAMRLGDNIQVIDSAMNTVEMSNKNMVNNMEEICNVMDIMTSCVSSSDEINRTMMSKYEETSININKIENIVNRLMEELGDGGFMGVEDIKPGMKASIVFDDEKDPELHIDIARRENNDLFVELPIDKTTLKKYNNTCYLRIIVDNVLYNWSSLPIHATKEPNIYRISVHKPASVMNRRKYSRYTLDNPCTIQIEDSNKTYHGNMINISANGFAFEIADSHFSATAEKKQIKVQIEDFLTDKIDSIDGIIIRSSDTGKNYIVGCRMNAEYPELNKYLNQNLEEYLY